MFSKIFSIVLIYTLSVINFTIILLPFAILVFPFIDFSNEKYLSDILLVLSVLVFLISAIMLAYIFLDFVFGFSVNGFLKGCESYKKIEDLKVLHTPFKQVKERFGVKGVKLFIKPSKEVNAFAVASFNRKYIVITFGLIEMLAKNTSSQEEFLLAIRGIMGHEMSHLINRDFLPGLLININSKATNIVAKIVTLFFHAIIKLLSVIPVVGNLLARIILLIERFLNYVINSFHTYIIIKVYNFLKNTASRGIEYRCDKQSAEAFSGQNMSYSLSFLGESGYFTIFSSHPSTRSRIETVKEVKIRKGIIREPFVSVLANTIAMVILIGVCLYLGSKINASGLLENLHNNIYKVIGFIHKIQRMYQSFVRDIFGRF